MWTYGNDTRKPSEGSGEKCHIVYLEVSTYSLECNVCQVCQVYDHNVGRDFVLVVQDSSDCCRHKRQTGYGRFSSCRFAVDNANPPPHIGVFLCSKRAKEINFHFTKNSVSRGSEIEAGCTSLTRGTCKSAISKSSCVSDI